MRSGKPIEWSYEDPCIFLWFSIWVWEEKIFIERIESIYPHLQTLEASLRSACRRVRLVLHIRNRQRPWRVRYVWFYYQSVRGPGPPTPIYSWAAKRPLKSEYQFAILTRAWSFSGAGFWVAPSHDAVDILLNGKKSHSPKMHCQ